MTSIMKNDLHRHAGGAISPETVWTIIENDPKLSNLARSLDHVYSLMTFRGDDRYNFHRFLAKFRILDNITWTEDTIDLTIKQIVKDLSNEGVDYCELRFSINKYLSYINWDEQEACLFFLERLQHWADEYNVEIGPVLSIKYEMPKTYAKRMSKLVNNWSIGDRLAGLDFVGNESMFDHEFLKQVYRYWKTCGKGLLIHAGESQSAENVRKAIEYLNPDRIAHGIRVPEEAPELLQVMIDNDIPFDVALRSNLYTGVVDDINDHPVKKMLEAGCSITLGTDDPVTFDTNLDKEYQLLAQILDVDIESNVIKNVMRNSENYALKKLKS